MNNNLTINIINNGFPISGAPLLDNSIKNLSFYIELKVESRIHRKASDGKFKYWLMSKIDFYTIKNGMFQFIGKVLHIINLNLQRRAHARGLNYSYSCFSM